MGISQGEGKGSIMIRLGLESWEKVEVSGGTRQELRCVLWSCCDRCRNGTEVIDGRSG